MNRILMTMDGNDYDHEEKLTAPSYATKKQINNIFNATSKFVNPDKSKTRFRLKCSIKERI